MDVIDPGVSIDVVELCREYVTYIISIGQHSVHFSISFLESHVLFQFDYPIVASGIFDEEVLVVKHVQEARQFIDREREVGTIQVAEVHSSTTAGKANQTIQE